MDKILVELKKLSNKALNNDEVPVSCIITDHNNFIIAKAYNKKEKTNDPMAHAEILAIKKATKKLKTNNLSDLILYSLLEPCNMCKEVIKESRIKKVYYYISKSKIVNDNTEYKKLDISNKEYNEISKNISDFFRSKR